MIVANIVNFRFPRARKHTNIFKHCILDFERREETGNEMRQRRGNNSSKPITIIPVEEDSKNNYNNIINVDKDKNNNNNYNLNTDSNIQKQQQQKEVITSKNENVKSANITITTINSIDKLSSSSMKEEKKTKISLLLLKKILLFSCYMLSLSILCIGFYYRTIKKQNDVLNKEEILSFHNGKSCCNMTYSQYQFLPIELSLQKKYKQQKQRNNKYRLLKFIDARDIRYKQTTLLSKKKFNPNNHELYPLYKTYVPSIIRTKVQNLK